MVNCIVIHKKLNECKEVLSMIKSDERCLLLSDITSSEKFNAINEECLPDVVFISYDCCNIHFVEIVQRVKKYVHIVFMVREEELETAKDSTFKHIVLSEVINQTKWDQIITEVMNQKMAVTNELENFIK